MTNAEYLEAHIKYIQRRMDDIRKIAFDIPPPNVYTPQLVQVSQAVDFATYTILTLLSRVEAPDKDPSSDP